MSTGTEYSLHVSQDSLSDQGLLRQTAAITRQPQIIPLLPESSWRAPIFDRGALGNLVVNLAPASA